MNESRRKVFALFAASLFLMAGFTVIVASEEENEVEAIGAVGGFFVGFFVGLLVGIALQPPMGDSEEVSRAAEAEILASSLSAGASTYANSLSQYATMWPLTNEHWIRQAELSATSMWSPDAEYDYSATLEDSSVYDNMGQMIDNMTTQINAHWAQIGDRIQLWNSTTYAAVYGDGKMSMGIALDDAEISTTDGEFDVRAGVVLRDVTSSNNKAWFAGGPIYSSEPSVIICGNQRYSLEAGWNENIPETVDFEGGIWTFQSGVTYCGDIMPIMDANAAVGQAGFVIDVDGQSKVITAANMTSTSDQYKPECDAFDGSTYYDVVEMRITPDEEANVQAVDLTDVLARLQMVISTMSQTLPQIANASGTVWRTFSDSGEANAFYTTLMVPESYNNVELTATQLDMITALAMEQLYQWWGDNRNDVVKGEYEMTFDSLSLYCRGNVVINDYQLPGESGNRQVEYRDVIFTPIFYESYDLRTGTNTINDTGFVMIWARDQSLSTFDQTETADAKLIFVGEGAELQIANMMYGGEYTESIRLDAASIADIAADNPIIPNPVMPEPVNDLDEIVRLVFVIVGILLMAAAVASNNYVWLIIGLAVIVVGFIISGPLAELLESLFGWEVHL